MEHDIKRPINDGLLVIDYGSQYTLLIVRRLREIGVYAEVMSSDAKTPPTDYNVRGIILSGGPDSVGETGSRTLPAWILTSQLPILGICYGMQLLVEAFGGKIESGTHREYGKATLKKEPSLRGLSQAWLGPIPHSSVVWMSHGDSATNLGQFQTLGRTDSGIIAAIAHRELPIFGLQFHPEVQHTESGAEILKGFAAEICNAPFNWHNKDRLEATIRHIQEAVGKGRVLMAVSGGVDSTVAIKLLSRALGPDRVTAVFIDNGLLRQNEAEEVTTTYHKLGLENLHVLPKQREFLTKLAGVTDPETKRKIIGRSFIEAFQTFADEHHDEFTHLGQGTLYPDVIESAGHGSGAKIIKSHHNVGGLPEKLGFKLIEPFRYLFKDEVRQIGLDLGIPHPTVFRHPFPGPGLAVRVLGEITDEKLAILRKADKIFIDRLKESNLYDSVWQAFAVLLPVRSVGVMGDNRTYQWTLALRAVEASDGMTASSARLPMDFISEVADTIVRSVDGINRVVYDLTSKPPATIEWE